MVKRYPYTKTIPLTKAGTGVEYISDDPVKPGRRVVLRNIAVEDETSALTYVRVGKNSGGQFFPWAEQKSPAAGSLSFDHKEWWIREGEYFQAKLNGGAASDVCKAYIDGYWFEYKEE